DRRARLLGVGGAARADAVTALGHVAEPLRGATGHRGGRGLALSGDAGAHVLAAGRGRQGAFALGIGARGDGGAGAIGGAGVGHRTRLAEPVAGGVAADRVVGGTEAALAALAHGAGIAGHALRRAAARIAPVKRRAVASGDAGHADVAGADPALAVVRQ